ncbi:uncharacterized protein LOC8280751 [Ricinus communis]|uniref:uncharacterized protein LOC8280751 n=1 Tax=Ricinus communis TaxID=3988 RepID=UPI00201B073D|nr:uncharacterized protein LOC8280751 [Ricinus communis]
MDEILKAALAYFEFGNHEFKKGTLHFLEMLDHCTDGTIGQFEEFLRERGHEPLSPGILKELGKKLDDHLGFNDFLVLLYVVKTRRPCCDLCQAFLKGLYFTCAVCFDEEEKTFNMCLDCTSKQKTCPQGHALFIDNFALLHSKSKAIELQLKENPRKCRVPMMDNCQSLPKEKIQLHDLFQHLEEGFVFEKIQHIPGVNFSSDRMGNNSSKVCNIG